MDRAAAPRPRTLTVAGYGRAADLPVSGTRVLSRAALDHALLEAAREAGVEIRTGTTARLGPPEGEFRHLVLSGDRPSPPATTKHSSAPSAAGPHRRTPTPLRARLVLGATGLTPLAPAAARAVPAVPTTRDAHAASDASDAAPLDAPELRSAAPALRIRPDSRIGVGARFPADTFPASTVAPDRVAMRVGPGGYVGLSVLEDGTVDLAGALDPDRIREAGGIEAAVVALLTHSGLPAPAAPPIDGWRGTPKLTRTAAPAGAERLLLIGDAAGYLEPFTGEGMRWAIESARAVVPHALAVLEQGWSPARLTAWDRAVRAHRRTRLVARGVTWVSRSPRRIRLALALLARMPGLAVPLVRHASGTASTTPAPPISTRLRATP